MKKDYFKLTKIVKLIRQFVGYIMLGRLFVYYQIRLGRLFMFLLRFLV